MLTRFRCSNKWRGEKAKNFLKAFDNAKLRGNLISLTQTNYFGNFLLKYSTPKFNNY